MNAESSRGKARVGWMVALLLVGVMGSVGWRELRPSALHDGSGVTPHANAAVADVPQASPNDPVQRRVEVVEPTTSGSAEVPAIEAATASTHSIRIEGFVLLPDGSPGVGEHVEVLLSVQGL